MGLVQSVIERQGISTVSITMLRDVTEKVRPPRALFIDTPLGYPLGEPNNAALQRRVMVAALALLSEGDDLPLIREFAI